jgi:hypothetical protein
MKKMIWRVALLGLLVSLLPLQVFAAAAKDPLHEEMEAINKAYRLLKRDYQNPAVASNTVARSTAGGASNAVLATSPTTLVSAMLQHAQTAQKLNPLPAATLTADAQAKYLEVFHKDMDDLIKETEALKTAIENNRISDITSELDKIAVLQKSSYLELGLVNGHKVALPPSGQ